MKFGETFDKNKMEGWKYIRYKALKNLIKVSTTEVKQEDTGKNVHWSAIFLSQLILQIEDVNTFFLGMERMLQQRCQDYDKTKDLNGLMAKQISKLMKDLCSYVVLNYLAVRDVLVLYHTISKTRRHTPDTPNTGTQDHEETR